MRALLLLACLGCSTEDVFLAPDLPAVPPTDFSVADLSVEPPDLAHPPIIDFDLGWNSCAGTGIAGTCVAAYFDSFAACFQPAGHCIVTPHNFGMYAVWDDQAVYSTGMGVPGETVRGYRMGSLECLSVVLSQAAPSIQHFCRPGESCSEGDAGLPQGATFDSASGIFTCPDGTMVDVGSDFGGCTALNTLLLPKPLCDGPFWN